MARILLIDDEPDIRAVVRILLEPYGHEVLLGEDGLRGFGMAQHQRPDVILLDLMMPILDGHAALQMIRGDERTSHIPVVVLTAVSQRAVHDRCMLEGADRVLTKPFDPDDLAGAIDEVLAAGHP
ncbi:MAG: response regulator [Actinomycetota bacterium]